MCYWCSQRCSSNSYSVAYCSDAPKAEAAYCKKELDALKVDVRVSNSLNEQYVTANGQLQVELSSTSLQLAGNSSALATAVIEAAANATLVQKLTFEKDVLTEQLVDTISQARTAAADAEATLRGVQAKAVELTGENHELVELTEITAQKETAVAAALAATDEKNRLQDQLSAERAAAELKTAADAGALAALNSKYDLLYDELAARDKQLAAMTARATEAEAEIFAGKLSKTLDNMLADNRNAFQRWRDSPTQPTAAADVASFKQVVLAACMLQVHVVTEFERFMKSSTLFSQCSTSSNS
eukprot:21092-Heterococcus_DN1.PRE.1